jgi:hypothetical protein
MAITVLTIHALISEEVAVFRNRKIAMLQESVEFINSPLGRVHLEFGEELENRGTINPVAKELKNSLCYDSMYRFVINKDVAILDFDLFVLSIKVVDLNSRVENIQKVIPILGLERLDGIVKVGIRSVDGVLFAIKENNKEPSLRVSIQEVSGGFHNSSNL